MEVVLLGLLFVLYIIVNQRYNNSLEKLVLSMYNRIDVLHARIVDLERKVFELNDSDGK